jgi:regulator of protease activity HflC (stomatin/prohibitin superfamily)
MTAAIASAVVVLLVLLFVIIVIAKTVRIVPQAQACVVERLGRYSRTLGAGLHILVPFVDRITSRLDLREQVVSFQPQPVITEDNLVVSIDSVIYFQVTDPKAATYEIQNYIWGVEQLTVTTLRNVVGSMDLEATLTSRDQINSQLRGVLDEATGKWGIRVNRVELKAIDPPPSVQESMEKQMRAERDRRAAILTAEGIKQSQILTAQGEREATVLRAEGDKQSAILRAEGEAQAVQKVFDAIHQADPDPKLLAYQYLQALPEIAKGESNKVWVVPAELTGALENFASAFQSKPPRRWNCSNTRRGGRWRSSRTPTTSSTVRQPRWPCGRPPVRTVATCWPPAARRASTAWTRNRRLWSARRNRSAAPTSWAWGSWSSSPTPTARSTTAWACAASSRTRSGGTPRTPSCSSTTGRVGGRTPATVPTTGRGQAALDAIADAGNRWIFPGTEPHHVELALVAGSPEATHALDVSAGVDRAVASLSEHRAYLEGLGEHPMADPEFLRAFLEQTGSSVGVPAALAVEVWRF